MRALGLHTSRLELLLSSIASTMNATSESTAHNTNFGGAVMTHGRGGSCCFFSRTVHLYALCFVFLCKGYAEEEMEVVVV